MRPFTHIVMDMYKEVVRSPQYAARKRAMMQSMHSLPSIPAHLQHQQRHHLLGANAVPMRQNPPLPKQQHIIQHQQQQQQQQQPRHRVKGAFFRAQSRNSRSQPNLLSMTSPEKYGMVSRTDADGYGYVVVGRSLHQRTNSQPDCCTERGISPISNL